MYNLIKDIGKFLFGFIPVSRKRYEETNNLSGKLDKLNDKVDSNQERNDKRLEKTCERIDKMYDLLIGNK